MYLAERISGLLLRNCSWLLAKYNSRSDTERCRFFYCMYSSLSIHEKVKTLFHEKQLVGADEARRKKLSIFKRKNRVEMTTFRRRATNFILCLLRRNETWLSNNFLTFHFFHDFVSSHALSPQSGGCVHE